LKFFGLELNVEHVMAGFLGVLIKKLDNTKLSLHKQVYSSGSYKLLKLKMSRNDRIMFKECFETIISLGVNKTNASLT